MPPPDDFDPDAITPARRARLAGALPLLAAARRDAVARGGDPWQLAVPACELIAAGLTGPDLRWLIAFGLADHAHERPHQRGRRRFTAALGPALAAGSCLLLTEAGAALAERWPIPAAPGPLGDPVRSVPHWDSALRELTYHGSVVKRLAQPSRCQETILAAFEEDRWVRRIDNPLGATGDSDAQERLHNALRRLNRQRGVVRLWFWRDGSGEGVCWAGVNGRPGRRTQSGPGGHPERL